MITLDGWGILALALLGWLGFNALFVLLGRWAQNRRAERWRADAHRRMVRRRDMATKVQGDDQ